MNKKQAVIIVTLLVLIVCAGILAAKVNSPLYVSDNDFGGSDNSTALINNATNNSTTGGTSNSTNSAVNNATNNATKGSSTKTSASSNFFASSKLTRDQADAKTIETLKMIIDDKNTKQEDKDSATKESIAIATATKNAKTIENMIVNKGYADAFCIITDNKVSITVKCQDEKLTDKQQREIRDIALNVTNMRSIEIQAKTQ